MLKRAALGLIRVYKVAISPMLGPRCRYLPTCSEYAAEAISRHGFWPGGWMTAARLCRCHPLGASGWDPVPPTPPARARWFTPWAYGRWSWRAPKGT